MDIFTPEEIENIELSNMNNIIKKINMPEQSRNIYRDYIILWKDLSIVSEKYHMSPDRIKLIINNISKLIGEYELSLVKKPEFKEEDLVSNPYGDEAP